MTGLAAGIGAKLIFGNLLGSIGRGLKAVASFAIANWKPLAIIAAAAAIVIYILILHGEIRHRDKTIAGQAALIGQVKTEVDRGVCQQTPKGQRCKPTPANDAPIYIHGIVDDLATMQGALERQSAALRAAATDAKAHVTAAHQAAQPTQAQGERDKVRQKIADPARTTGLTNEEWSKL